MRTTLLSLALLAALPAWAAPPDAEASDPARLGWMRGAPPPPERTIRPCASTCTWSGRT